MRFAIVVPNTPPYCQPNLLKQIVSEAEESGFDGFFLWDHYMLKDTWVKSDETFDAYSTLAYVAQGTSRITLGTCITPLPLRHPAVTAKVVATLDLLTGGRVIVGVGAGWYRPEFEAYSQWFDSSTRVGIVEEAVNIMKRLWTEDVVDFQGKYYKISRAVLLPKPIQKPHPRLWFGSSSRRMLDLAVRYGNGWLPMDLDPVDYWNLKTRMEKTIPSVDHFTYACYNSRIFQKESEYNKVIESYAQAGCEYFATLWKFPPNRWRKKIRDFGRNVLGSFV